MSNHDGLRLLCSGFLKSMNVGGTKKSWAELVKARPVYLYQNAL